MFLLFASASLSAPSCAVAQSDARSAPTVARVLEGDVVELSNGREVRLRGVEGLSPQDTTQLRPWARATPLTLSDLKSLGRLSRRYAAELVKGRPVEVEAGSTGSGSGVYLWVLDGNGQRAFLLNARMIIDGFAYVRTSGSYERRQYFRAYQREARTADRGLWASDSALPSFVLPKPSPSTEVSDSR